MVASSSGWTAGVVHHGPPQPERHSKPISRITLTRTETLTYENYFVTAQEAFEERVRRLREAGDKYEVDGMTVRFRDGNTDVTLTYEEIA